jgi:hypothetical protein
MLDINSLLIMPIQRLPRYVMLLQVIYFMLIDSLSCADFSGIKDSYSNNAYSLSRALRSIQVNV